MVLTRSMKDTPREEVYKKLRDVESENENLKDGYMELYHKYLLALHQNRSDASTHSLETFFIFLIITLLFVYTLYMMKLVHP